jgi:hypothetical protein
MDIGNVFEPDVDPEEREEMDRVIRLAYQLAQQRGEAEAQPRDFAEAQRLVDGSRNSIPVARQSE